MESNSTPLKMPHTKFEAISLKDVGGGGGGERQAGNKDTICVMPNFVL